MKRTFKDTDLRELLRIIKLLLLSNARSTFIAFLHCSDNLLETRKYLLNLLIISSVF